MAQADKSTATDVQAKHDAIPTLFVDGLFGASVVSGVARLDLFAEHFGVGSPGVQRLVVGRLAIPAERVEIFARALGELVTRLQQAQQQPQPQNQPSKK